MGLVCGIGGLVCRSRGTLFLCAELYMLRTDLNNNDKDIFIIIAFLIN